VRIALAILLLAAITGCASDPAAEPAPPSSEPPTNGGAAPPPDAGDGAAPPLDAGGGTGPPPDAGVARGHAGDPRRVPVPGRDRTPPRATITLAGAGGEALAEAAMPGAPHRAVVRLERPRLLGTTVGQDADSGVARVRVSMRERLVCRDAGGATFERARLRYVPAPQIERIRSSPGALLSTRAERSVPRDLSSTRCGRGAEVMHAEGEVWGEAINGLGLEAVTPHIRFEYLP
jgi:hypothetical protein